VAPNFLGGPCSWNLLPSRKKPLPGEGRRRPRGRGKVNPAARPKKRTPWPFWSPPRHDLASRPPLSLDSASLLTTSLGCTSSALCNSLSLSWKYRRQRETATRLPAHHVVYFVIASRCGATRVSPTSGRAPHALAQLPNQTLPPSLTPQTPRVRPMRSLFRAWSVRRPLCSMPSTSTGGCWPSTAPSGDADTPENRESSARPATALPAAFLSSAWPPCAKYEATPSSISSSAVQQQRTGLERALLERTPGGCLVLMGPGTEHFEPVKAVVERHSDGAGPVKVSRALPVRKCWPDGSYLSHIYPSYTTAAQGRRIAVRVIATATTTPSEWLRGGNCLITTVLTGGAPRQGGGDVYPWSGRRIGAGRGEDGDATGQQPLLRSKKPELCSKSCTGC